MKKIIGFLFIFIALFFSVGQASSMRGPLQSCIASAQAYYDQQNSDCIWASQQDPNFNLPACFGSVDNQFSQDLGACYRSYGEER